MNGWNELKNKIIEKDLCSLCGTCIGLCPIATLSYDSKNERIINERNNCVYCGLCIKNCPGESFDYKYMNKLVFMEDDSKINADVGFYQKILRGHSLHEFVQKNCSSGGIATEIGLYMLEKGLVDYVIGITGEYPYYRVSAINDKEQLYQTMQSKYTFVPTNEILRFILANKGKYLYVGLPCQVQGLRKACENNRVLSERIELCVAIFCGFNMERDATDFLIYKSNIKNIKKIEYRAVRNGNTGFLIKGDQKEFFISKHGYTILNTFYSRKRCWKCYDLTGEFSDVSLGDAWEKGHGWSRIIIRTEKARCLIESMRRDGFIFYEPSSVNDIYETQSKLIFFKKRSFATRRHLIKHFPDNNIELKKNSLLVKLKASLFLFIMVIGKTKPFRLLLRLCPVKILEKISEFMRNGTSIEIINYGIWGIVTVLTSFISYWVFIQLGLDYKISNVLAIIFTKLTAYLTNKYFVFHSKCENISALIREFSGFLISRGLSGIVEIFGLILLVDFFHIGKYFGKILLIVITTILNYSLGKNFVYKSSKRNT